MFCFSVYLKSYFSAIVCGPNSTPSDCASLCPRTCNSDKEPRFCAAVCVRGCVCNPGYIDDGYGNCIPENECPGNNSKFCYSIDTNI